jgi:hypothetical protein
MHLAKEVAEVTLDTMLIEHSIEGLSLPRITILFLEYKLKVK